MKAGWGLRQLGEICLKITDGSHNPPKGVDFSEFVMLSSRNVLDGQITIDSPRYLSSIDFAIENKRTDLRPGDVLLTIVGTVGRAAVVPDDLKNVTLQRSVAVLRPDLAIVDSRFLMFCLQCLAPELQAQSQGVAQKGIYLKALSAVSIPIPPIEEQRRIVAVLDEAFAAIATATANAEKNLSNARELFEADARETFASLLAPGWFDELRVESIAAKHKGSMRTGPFGSQLLHSEFIDSGIAVLGIDNAVANEFRWGKQRFISEEKYEQLSRFLVHPGDVIITIMGTCGRCAVIPDEMPTAINSKHLFCITLDRSRCLPGYLHAYFLYAPDAREYLDNRAQGSIMAGLNMGIIKEMPIRLPSLQTQAEIVERIAQAKQNTTDLAGVYHKRLSQLAALKQSLLNRAFTGELTIPAPVPISA